MVTYMLISRKDSLVPTFCLLHVFERGQNERSAPLADAFCHGVHSVAQEGAHGRAPVRAYCEVYIEQ